MPRWVAKTRELPVVRHHAHDANSRCRHHYRHHTQKARCFEHRAFIVFSLVAGAGFEPATFGL
jgi:hypothetical protein